MQAECSALNLVAAAQLGARIFLYILDEVAFYVSSLDSRKRRECLENRYTTCPAHSRASSGKHPITPPPAPVPSLIHHRQYRVRVPARRNGVIAAQPSTMCTGETWNAHTRHHAELKQLASHKVQANKQQAADASASARSAAAVEQRGTTGSYDSNDGSSKDCRHFQQLQAHMRSCGTAPTGQTDAASAANNARLVAAVKAAGALRALRVHKLRMGGYRSPGGHMGSRTSSRTSLSLPTVREETDGEEHRPTHDELDPACLYYFPRRESMDYFEEVGLDDTFPQKVSFAMLPGFARVSSSSR
eukprot:6197581-Pleurochrysis_carterae.AAC.1